MEKQDMKIKNKIAGAVNYFTIQRNHHHFHLVWDEPEPDGHLPEKYVGKHHAGRLPCI